MKLFDPETLFLIGVLCFFFATGGALLGWLACALFTAGSKADEIAERYGPK